MQYVLLNNGVRMPILGFGVYQIEDAAQCERAVADALAAGYRLVDTAAAYLNEEAVGRAIGVCNFMPDRLVDLMDHNEIPPVIDQVEVNPFCQRETDRQLMEARGVRMQSWAPFAEGRNGLFRDPVLEDVAAGHGRTVAQVVLRWLVQRGVVCIPKSVHRERIEENFRVFDFELTDADMQRIAALDTGRSCFFSHDDPEIVSWLGTVRFDI